MKNLIKCLLALPLILVSCEENEMATLPTQENSTLNLNELKLERIDVNIENDLFSKNSDKKGSFENFVTDFNKALLEYNIQLVKMELLGEEYEAGNTVVFNDVGNKQAPSDFVPNDPRNFFPGTNVLFWTDGTEQGTEGTNYSMTPSETLNAIYSSVNTWNSISCSEGVNFSHIFTTTPSDIYNDVGVVQRARGFGGAGWRINGSILHGGNLPAAFFEVLREGGGERTLGVTFTFIFFDQTGPTDIDQNGKNDVAFREIYINGSRNFQDAPGDVMNNGIIDYETVVMHEVGHGLSQNHFGKAIEGKNGKIHFAPSALMNAGYSKAQREITATDNAGHCGIWENWPYE